MARLIDADALMNELQSMVMYENDGAVDCGSYNTAIIDAKAAISSAPTLYPDEVRGVGKWKMWEDYYGSNVYQCSVCGADWDMIDGTPEDNDMKYCPSCGARMKGAEDGTTD